MRLVCRPPWFLLRRCLPLPLAALLATLLSTPLAGCGTGEPARPVVAGGDAKLGQRLLARYQCGACHAIPGVMAARGQVGPALARFDQRSYIAGSIPNQPEAMVRWIADPQAMKAGTAMPSMGVPAADARHMAAYLYAVR